MDFFSFPTLMSFCLGIGLAASAGFRVFVPLLALSLGVHFGGDYINISEGWQWVGSWPAIITLSVATLVEVLAYYIPFIDNLLDSISVPLAAVAGTFLMAASMPEMGEVGSWALSIIAGGGTATLVSGATAATRALSTSTTGGTGNFVVNTGETTASSVLSVTAFIWAPLALLMVIVVFYFIYRLWRKRKKLFASD